MSEEKTEFRPEEMKDLFATLAKLLKENESLQVDDDIKYPIQVETFNTFEVKGKKSRKVGNYVSIRPCAKEFENKTYLGIYLGEFPVGTMATYHPDKKQFGIVLKNNPAIFVPDLNQVVYGMESWWGEINTPEDLKQITNQDIENVWYVKALHAMAEKDLDKKEEKQ